MQIDESNAGELLSPLDGDPPGPSSVDIGQAMQDGRRRRRAHRAVLAAGISGLTVLAVAAVPVSLTFRSKPDTSQALLEQTVSPSPSAAASPSPSTRPSPVPKASPSASLPPPPNAPAAPTSCKAEKLPIPDNLSMALVTAADPTGRLIFGRSYPAAGQHQVILWRDGNATKIDVPGDEESFDAVNAGGVGVGQSFTSEGSTAWLYRDGKVTKLPGGDAATTVGINAGNAIVGNKAGRPLIWRTPTSEPEELRLPADAVGGRARAIDDDGTVVGTIMTTQGQVAYAWAPDGTGRVLPIIGDPGRVGSTTYAVRNGWVIGGVNSRGLRWNLGTGQVEEVSGVVIRPGAVNSAGWMVGTDAQGRGVLLAAGKTVRLPDVYTHKAGELSNMPGTISDDGTVLTGQANDANGVIHAVVWRCG